MAIIIYDYLIVLCTLVGPWSFFSLIFVVICSIFNSNNALVGELRYCRTVTVIVIVISGDT